MSTTTYKQKHIKQINLIFRLSMPGTGPNGERWNSDNRVHALIRPVPRNLKSTENANKLLAAKSWRYDFGDGWIAQVDVEQGTQQTVHRARRLSQGFCGYDWMVASILEHGEIKSNEPA
jgi:hypothetical protein